MQGTNLFAGLVGPALAGFVIAVLPPTDGNGLAFTLDAASFLLAAFALVLVRYRRGVAPTSGSANGSGLLTSVTDGLRYAWSDPVLRALVLVSVALNSTNGALTVGLPTLAHARFSHGAAALGLIFSAQAGGGLLGTLIGGSLRRPPPRGPSIIVLAFGLSAVELVVGLVPVLTVTISVMALLGAGTGFLNVILVTWLQARTDPQMLGRIISLFTFGTLAFTPIAVVVSGAIAAISVSLLFIVAASILAVAAVGTSLSKTIRDVR